ncbi:hypothetical protein BV898_11842 [Hypsibius exemplaris]|uniref:G-protein coupled receptors family 1 profile domain-containing protein n=1 Tax=Hypsibius exemplaris TaxID=2072580 RepID=A0A1W0WFG8_HYPEX|nr:hypothetical protein BV898_11842 [Hypsibius exemplaris]
MSVDRWLSTEFPVVYKNHISRGKVLTLIGAVWTYYLCQYIVMYATFPGSFVITCQKVMFFGYRERWWSVFSSMQYPIYVSIMTLTQARIAMLAIQAKLKVLRNRIMVNFASESMGITDKASASAVTKNPSPTTVGRQAARKNVRSAGLLLRSMWKTVLAGSVVVIVAIVCNVPVVIVTEYSRGIKLTTTGRTTAYLVSNFQYISPTVTYFLFYANFRRCAVEIIAKARSKVGIQ